jgi:hypothetical protein
MSQFSVGRGVYFTNQGKSYGDDFERPTPDKRSSRRFKTSTAAEQHITSALQTEYQGSHFFE